MLHLRSHRVERGDVELHDEGAVIGVGGQVRGHGAALRAGREGIESLPTEFEEGVVAPAHSPILDRARPLGGDRRCDDAACVGVIRLGDGAGIDLAPRERGGRAGEARQPHVRHSVGRTLNERTIHVQKRGAGAHINRRFIRRRCRE